MAPKTIAPIKNIIKLNQAYRSLVDRETDEGLGLIWGQPGLGKTTGACALFVQERGVLITAKPGWKQRALLDELLRQLQGDQRHMTNAQKLDECCRLLIDNPRTLFVDEADFLFDAGRTTLETLRSLHDSTGCPILLIGMTTLGGTIGIDKRVLRYPQISDRITAWIEFQPCDINDVAILASTLYPTLALADDLKQHLLASTKGNVRRLRTELVQVNRKASLLKTKDLDLKAYTGKRSPGGVAPAAAPTNTANELAS